MTNCLVQKVTSISVQISAHRPSLLELVSRSVRYLNQSLDLKVKDIARLLFQMTPSVFISLALATAYAKTMSVSNMTVSADSSVSQTTYSVAAPDSACYTGDFRCERNPGEHIITYCLMVGSVVSCNVCSGKTCTMYEGARGN